MTNASKGYALLIAAGVLAIFAATGYQMRPSILVAVAIIAAAIGLRRALEWTPEADIRRRLELERALHRGRDDKRL